MLLTLLPRRAPFSSLTLGHYRLPDIKNEPLLSYGPNTPERDLLIRELKAMQNEVHHVPCIINGNKMHLKDKASQVIPHNHQKVLCEYSLADETVVQTAIEGALEAKKSWEALTLTDRCAIFLKAADLLCSPGFRYKLLASTMLGQGKTVWQAEIDAIGELADFWRFNAHFAMDIWAQQPSHHAPGVWNRLEYRPLEGFVYAVTPFNFTAIGGNLACAPALLGNVVLWKPSHSAVLSNALVLQVLHAAGLPPGVIQFLPGRAEVVTPPILRHSQLAGLHFTGSSAVFKRLQREIAANLDVYRSFPRVVGETGGKNFHLVHSSAPLTDVAHQTIRAAFEYQGQKCSACSRLYVPRSCWPSLQDALLQAVVELQVGATDDLRSFMSAVIHRASFDKCVSYIEHARSHPQDYRILAGGTYDASVGFFVAPTIIESLKPQGKLMTEEIFGPILTVYVYEDDHFDDLLALIDSTSPYALTGAIFARDRNVINKVSAALKYSAGNFYINDKCTGAVVGQQPFGGGRLSGTNDKAGSPLNLLRWLSPRAIKESHLPLLHHSYPSCLP